MAIAQETKWAFKVRSGTTGQFLLDEEDRLVYYVSPPGFVLTAGFVLTDEIVALQGWRRYDYDTDPLIGTSCDVPGETPDDGDPIWLPETSSSPGQTAFTIPAPVAGVPYSTVIPFSAVIPDENKTIVNITLEDHPYLTLLADTATSRKLVGNVPVGITSMSVALIAVQSDGRTARKTFTKTAVSELPYLFVSYNKNTRRLSLYIGPYNGSGNPEVSLYDCPSYYNDKATYSAGAIQSILLPNTTGKLYSYFMPYERIVTGDYVPRIKWLNQTLYGSFTLQEETDFVQEIALSPNAPELQGDQGPDFDGVEEVSIPIGIDKAAWAWVRMTAGVDSSNRVYTYYKATGGAVEVKFYQPVSGNPETGWLTASAISGDVEGYNYRFDINNIAGSVTYKARIIGYPETEISFTFVVPSGATTTRVQIYP